MYHLTNSTVSGTSRAFKSFLKTGRPCVSIVSASCPNSLLRRTGVTELQSLTQQIVWSVRSVSYTHPTSLNHSFSGFAVLEIPWTPAVFSTPKSPVQLEFAQLGCCTSSKSSYQCLVASEFESDGWLSMVFHQKHITYHNIKSSSMLPAPQHLWFCCGTGPVRLHPLSSFGRRPNVCNPHLHRHLGLFEEKKTQRFKSSLFFSFSMTSVRSSSVAFLDFAQQHRNTHMWSPVLLLWHRPFISRPRLAENWNASTWLLSNSCLVAPLVLLWWVRMSNTSPGAKDSCQRLQFLTISLWMS